MGIAIKTSCRSPCGWGRLEPAETEILKQNSNILLPPLSPHYFFKSSVIVVLSADTDVVLSVGLHTGMRSIDMKGGSKFSRTASDSRATLPDEDGFVVGEK